MNASKAQELIDVIKNSTAFYEAWEAMFSTKAHEELTLKDICAGFFFHGAAFMEVERKNFEDACKH